MRVGVYYSASKDASENIHKIPISNLIKKFHSSKRTGLNEEQAKINEELFGKNIISERKPLPLPLRFLLQFKNFFSILLLTGALLSFIADKINHDSNSLIIAYALLGVTFLNALFTFIQEYQADRAMKSFKNLMPSKIIVIREGKKKEIDTEYLVPGDIIYLKEGDKIPVDGRVIESSLLRVDHSSLTGESEPKLRSTKASSEKMLLSQNMVFSGTLVQSGIGKILALRTGNATEIGRIAHLTTRTKKKTSKMQVEIQSFVKLISKIAFVLGIVFFGLGFLVGRTYWESIVFAIGIIVANVPEGLLPTVTLTLSLAAKRMAKRKALVRDIESIETLGGVTTICSDKTGTLTQNKLKINSLIFNGKKYLYEEFHKTFYDDIEEHYLHPKRDSYFSRLLDTMFLCNNSVVEVPEHKEGNNDFPEHKAIGDPTEIALKEGVLSQKHFHEYEDFKREAEIPFDAEKKYMITATELEGERTAHLKGSIEKVLEKSKYIISNNKKTLLSSKVKNQLLKENEDLALKGMRVLAIAYKPLDSLVANSKILEKEDYIFLGLVALQDPPRKEVPEAVSSCVSAGIRIIVISGDHPTTVRAIAKQVGIINSSDEKEFVNKKTGEIETNVKVLTSADLELLSDKELRELLKNKNKKLIFARALPEDKLRIVNALQDLGETVAVTGDGVNDAPALKQADVGVAMGITGTDVAKEAANIVLLDDNFATIIKAIKSGRTVFENIKKFILYILTSNVPEILPFLLFVLFGWPLALPVILILAIDLGTDMIPAISLGLEEPESDLMKKPPRKKDAKLLTKSMLFRSYGIIGPLESLFSYIVFFHILITGGWSFGEQIAINNPLYRSAIAAFFATTIIIQVFNLFASRTFRNSIFSMKHFFRNKFLFLGIFTELVLLIVIIYLPVGQLVFNTLPFNLGYLWFMIGSGIFILLIEELRKYLSRTKGLFSVE